MRDLFFSIRARDMTAAAFDKVKRGLGAIDGAMANASERADRFGQKLVGIGTVMSGVMGSIVFAFRDSLSLWDTQERAQAKVEQAVRQTGMAAGFAADELFKQASALQAVTRFGDEAILDGITAQFLTFTNITGDAFTRAQESVLDLSTVLNTDLKGSAIMLGKALNDPVVGMGALAEAGITFTQEQKNVVKALMDTGRIAEAQAVILDEIQRVYGGQARAAAEVGTGFLIQFQNAWGDLKETVGGVVAQLLPPVLKFFTVLADGFMGLPPLVQRGIVVFFGAAAALGALSLAAGVAVIALAPLSLPFVAISAAVAGAIALIAMFWPEIERAGRAVDVFMTELALGFVDMLQSTVENVVAGVNHIINAFQGAFDAVEAVWAALPDSIAGIVTLAANAMIIGVESMINGVIARINKLNEAVNGALSLLPEWATGEGGIRINAIADISLGRIENPEASGALKDAAAAYAAAFENQAFEVPDLGLGDRRDAIQADLDALRAIKPVADETADAINGVGAAVAPVVPLLDDLGGGLGGAGGAAKGAAAGLSGVGAAAAGAGDELDDLLKDLEEAENVMDGFGRETSDMFKSLFTTGRNEFESFGDFALEWGSRFLDRMLSSVFNPLGDALQTSLNGFFAGGAGGGGGGGGGGLIGGAANFLSGLLPGFDTGGTMAVAGRAGIDRNVAAFRVSQGETIKVTRRGEGGGGPAVNVHIHAADPAAFKASKGRIATDIARAVGSANRFT